MWPADSLVFEDFFLKPSQKQKNEKEKRKGISPHKRLELVWSYMVYAQDLELKLTDYP